MFSFLTEEDTGFSLSWPRRKQQRAGTVFSNVGFGCFQIFDLLYTNSLRNMGRTRQVLYYSSWRVFFHSLFVGEKWLLYVLLFWYSFSAGFVPTQDGASVQRPRLHDLNEIVCKSSCSTGCIYKGILLPTSRCSRCLLKLIILWWLSIWSKPVSVQWYFNLYLLLIFSL